MGEWYSGFGKPLRRACRTCTGHGGLGSRQQNLFTRQWGPVRGFGALFRISPGFGRIFGFSPWNQPQTLGLGQTKAKNGLSTLKTGDTTSPAPVGCQLGSVGGPANTNPPQPTANRPNQRPTDPTDGAHMVSPYVEGAEFLTLAAHGEYKRSCAACS